MTRDDRRPSCLLILNAGSSSLKFAVYEKSVDPGDTAGLAVLCKGQIAPLDGGARFTCTMTDWAGGDTSPPDALDHVTDHGAALALLFDWLAKSGRPLADFSAVGHRMVHGGSRYVDALLLTADEIAALDALIPLAPHHMPHNIGAAWAILAQAPHLPQVACFDTAFHASRSALEKRLPLPEAEIAGGVQSYGFHGLNYSHVLRTLPGHCGGVLPARLMVFHLGNGASACAIHDGRSVATTMGFSTAEGLVMGTRAGRLDPGVLIHLMRTKGYDAAALEDLNYNRAGLLGLSGVSADMRRLLADGSARAKFAVDKFCLAAAREAAALLPLLGGLDAVVFTGGIGENAPEVRSGIVDRLAFLGLRLDPVANAVGATCLTARGADITVHIIPADEERTIAEEVARLRAF